MRAYELATWVRDARQHTLALVADLTDDQLRVPQMWIVNPILWEIGHAAWFQEKWVLRDGGVAPSIRADADTLYDSIAVDHDIRWDIPLAKRAATLAYMEEVSQRVLARLKSASASGLSDRDAYLNRLAIYHEDMHCEALTYTRQTLCYSPPSLDRARVEPPPIKTPIVSDEHGSEPRASATGDAQIPGGRFMLGSKRDTPFVFDNEKWAHPVEVRPFSISRTVVTQGQFAAFVNDGGYRRDEFWDTEGRRWREATDAEHPVYWRRATGRAATARAVTARAATARAATVRERLPQESFGGWQRRHFDTWTALETNRPMIHVNWHEAQAYCAWAERRLPTEIEWEVAAAGEPAAGGGLSERKRRYPWGDESPDSRCANLDWRHMGCVDVDAYPAGDSAFGCRQMIGNTWEWTQTTFGPFPGFSPDAYKEYSAPWFDTHKVLRGGCWATRGRLIHNMLRNFYTPDRRDIWAGFRTCALQR